MRTYLSLPYEHDHPLPEGYTNEVRTPPALVERFLEEHTAAGDRVIDVFAGFGTTLRVAESMGREPYGLEYDPDLARLAAEAVSSPDRVRQGDVLELDPSWFPAADCCFTSPPFMERTDDRNPFENYAGQSRYERYLDDVESAFANLRGVMTEGGTVVVDVSNMKHEGRVTTLAWDVGRRVAGPLSFQGEVVVTWEGAGRPDSGGGRYGYGYDHSYCLVFSADDGGRPPNDT